MKAIGCAVAVALLLTLLAACGDGEGAQTSGGGQEAGAAETDDGQATEETEATEPETEPETETETEPESESEKVLPEGGNAPDFEDVGLPRAARAAGCELRSFPARSRDHTSDSGAEIDYSSSPPTSGRHAATPAPAPDGVYFNAPDAEALVHSLEHGRVVIWFKHDLPRGARADLRAFYEQDEVQTILTPDETGSDYELAATAWNRDSFPNGTGRLLGCERFTPEAFQALRAFQEKHRGQGPEAVP